MSWKRIELVLAIAVTVVGLAACRPPDPDVQEETPEKTPDIGDIGVIEVMVEDYSFMAPPTLRSGWTTFRMTNHGEEPHFMLLYRLPVGTTFDDYTAQLSQPFQEQYDRYTSGEVNQGELLAQLGGVLPEWLGSLEGIGGVGLTAPGRTAQTTVLLEPGDYVMECYLVSPEGKFHNSLGMLRPLIVTEEPTGMEAPPANISITLSNYEMTVMGEATAGEHTVAVHATENAEGIIGHDVHLARLAPDASIEDVIAWMSWIDGMRSPPPAEFLGGTEHVGAGRTSYMSVSLEPGRYAWISEGFASQGMVQEFVVE
ncbi:MAG: hypothetical protein BMS9Abin37_3309 [Acidobacteriota bacterium]|nr:MAG: hypothetical protein BMS9Abin37_3309 [Acidobacteriota bacterium]